MRALLLIFPNTFEYFFIAYEAIRSRWSVARYGMRFWVGVAAFIWIVIKLPQEYWIHVAQLDFTDTVDDYWWFGPLIVVGLLVLLAIAWFVVRPRLDPVDHGWEITAPPLPEDMDGAAKRDAWVAAHGKNPSTCVILRDARRHATRAPHLSRSRRLEGLTAVTGSGGIG